MYLVMKVVLLWVSATAAVTATEPPWRPMVRQLNSDLRMKVQAGCASARATQLRVVWMRESGHRRHRAQDSARNGSAALSDIKADSLLLQGQEEQHRSRLLSIDAHFVCGVTSSDTHVRCGQIKRFCRSSRRDSDRLRGRWRLCAAAGHSAAGSVTGAAAAVAGRGGRGISDLECRLCNRRRAIPDRKANCQSPSKRR